MIKFKYVTLKSLCFLTTTQRNAVFLWRFSIFFVGKWCWFRSFSAQNSQCCFLLINLNLYEALAFTSSSSCCRTVWTLKRTERLLKIKHKINWPQKFTIVSLNCLVHCPFVHRLLVRYWVVHHLLVHCLFVHRHLFDHVRYYYRCHLYP